jgi:phosphoribosylamine--glycine ligase
MASPWCSPACVISAIDRFGHGIEAIQRGHPVKVLIVGGGGREHALAWKCAQSPRVSQVYVAPGNGGTASEPKVQNVAIAVEDFDALLGFARDQDIGLTIIGPEGPIVAGIADHFRAANLACFAPSQAAARLEGSKSYSKDFLRRHGIPTAAYRVVGRDTFDPEQIRGQKLPIVVKADGLAAGKGVLVCDSHEAAIIAATGMLDGAFGTAGHSVVIEEFLSGEEISFIVMAHDQQVLPLATSQDHKRRDDGDCGPNTGGMGAYSPAPLVDDALHARIMREVITPTLRGLRQDGNPYTGFLYAGLMVAADGTPNVLEFNCRFGDPETQPIMMRLQSDLTVLCEAALDGTLDRVRADWDERAALGVVMAAGGYPGAYHSGDPISGLDAAARLPGKVFHAGTRAEASRIVTSGGRVLCAVGLGDSVSLAQRQAYDLVHAIHWDLVQYRRDIGHLAIARELR